MIVRIRESPAGVGDLVAALGGVALLVAIAVPVDWVTEESTGGISGQGTGEPPQGLTAFDLLGWALSPLALAAVVPLAELALAQVGRTIVAGARLVFVAAGLVVLVVDTGIALTYSLPPCCDQIYTMPSPEAGLFLALAGGALLALGTGIAWLQTRPRQMETSAYTDPADETTTD